MLGAIDDTCTGMRSSHNASGRLIIAISLAVGLVSCSGGCGAKKPHNPFETADSSVSAVEADSSSPVADAFSALTPNSTEWVFPGGKITAPGDRVFLQVASGDFDGDGALDAFAIAKAAADSGPGDVWFYRGGTAKMGEPEMVMPAPPFVSDPTCSPKPRMVRTGEHSIFAELAIECSGHEALSAKRVGALLIADKRGPRVHGSYTFQPPTGIDIELSGDATDRDGDGIDDVSFEATVNLAGGKSTARLVWLDRATGLSRHLDEPESSFRDLTKKIGARVSSAKDAKSVHADVDAMNILARLLCADGGGGPLALGGGLELPTCATSKSLRDAAFLDMRAYVTLRQVSEAIRAYERALESKEVPTATAIRDAEKVLTKLAPIAKADRASVVEGVTLPTRSKAVEWGALSFLTPNTFVVRGESEATEVDGRSGKVIGPSPENWGPRVVSMDGAFRFVEVYDPCDGGPFHATFAPERDGDPRDVILPIRSLFRPCKRGEGKATVIPMAWTTKGLSAVIAGAPLRISNGDPGAVVAIDLFDALDSPRGAPRSADGKIAALPTTLGVLVGNAKKKRLQRMEGVDPSSLTDCAPNNDASLLACVRGGRVVVGEWPPLQ